MPTEYIYYSIYYICIGLAVGAGGWIVEGDRRMSLFRFLIYGALAALAAGLALDLLPPRIGLIDNFIAAAVASVLADWAYAIHMRRKLNRNI